jgi:hypothetical protein
MPNNIAPLIPHPASFGQRHGWVSAEPHRPGLAEARVPPEPALADAALTAGNLETQPSTIWITGCFSFSTPTAVSRFITPTPISYDRT